MPYSPAGNRPEAEARIMTAFEQLPVQPGRGTFGLTIGNLG